MSTRLNKYISESGVCSRREADKYIERGSVTINGKRAKIGDMVYDGDRVTVHGNEIEPKTAENDILLAFNKPVGITSTTESSDKTNIVDYINYSERIFPIGRLDKDSQGLIFLTNNGDLVNKILRAGNKHEKEYVVTVDKPINDQFVETMSDGVPILGVNTRKCKVTKEGTFVFRIVLIQGLNRQIRRMCEHLGYNVTKLERVRIMHVSLKGIPPGEWREITGTDLQEIYKKLEKSSSDSNKAKSKANAKSDADAKERRDTRPAPTVKKKPDNEFERVQPKGVARPFRKGGATKPAVKAPGRSGGKPQASGKSKRGGGRRG